MYTDNNANDNMITELRLTMYKHTSPVLSHRDGGEGKFRRFDTAADSTRDHETGPGCLAERFPRGDDIDLGKKSIHKTSYGTFVFRL